MFTEGAFRVVSSAVSLVAKSVSQIVKIVNVLISNFDVSLRIYFTPPSVEIMGPGRICN